MFDSKILDQMIKGGLCVRSITAIWNYWQEMLPDTGMHGTVLGIVG
jgi:hypothetical protein